MSAMREIRVKERGYNGGEMGIGINGRPLRDIYTMSQLGGALTTEKTSKRRSTYAKREQGLWRGIRMAFVW